MSALREQRSAVELKGQEVAEAVLLPAYTREDSNLQHLGLGPSASTSWATRAWGTRQDSNLQLDLFQVRSAFTQR